MANVSFLAGSTRDLNNYILDNRQSQGVIDFFNQQQQYLINTGNYNPYTPGTVEYNNIQALNNKVMNNVTEAINYTYNPNNIIGRAQEVLDQVTIYDIDSFHRDLHNTKTLESMRDISYTTQAYILASPVIQDSISKGMLNGYGYNLMERSDIKGIDVKHIPEYIDSVNGVAFEDENGEMVVDEFVYGASNGMYDNRFELGMWEQERILELRELILRAKSKGIDVTRQD
jgi:hypothetical protein